MAPEMALRRVADLREAMTVRLMALRSWTEEQKAQHARDLKELDDILGAVSPTYTPNIEAARLEAAKWGA